MPTPRFALRTLSVAVVLAFASNASALPTGGAVTAGSAAIVGTPGKTTINQSSQNVAINWQSFNVGQKEAVQFVQPTSSSVALNRVMGADPSTILGSLSANGKVFLVNANGILFGSGAQVNVGGLVASTMNIADADFMAGRYKFAGSGSGAIVNQGAINADGGYVALLGARVSNEGVISARLGTIALAGGNATTLDIAGDRLLSVTVNEGAVDSLVRNGGMIRADGGQVLLTTQAAGNLLRGAVNNTGVIQAQTIENRNGTIKLLGDMQSGIVTVAGTLDASAPTGGDGGFIETSAARVTIANDAIVTTAGAVGRTGLWLIDPEDFVIGSVAGDNISGATLSALLVTNSVIINTNPGLDATVAGTPPVTTLNTSRDGNGDIFVNDAVAWSAAPSTTTLTLNALRDVNVNRAITATNGNLVVCCGRDVNVNAAITTTNGSVLLSAGRNANVAAAVTVTDGNLMICAGNDVIVSSALTLTRGSLIPAQALGLPVGMVLSAGNNGTGPGTLGGTVVFAPLTPPAAVTGPNAPVTIDYNPVAYTTPTDFLPNFTLTNGATLTQRMLVFPNVVDKTFDGTTAATISGFRTTVASGIPAGVVLVAGAGSTSSFVTPDVGLAKPVTFTGFSLGGANAGNFVLPVSCCGPVVGRTTGNVVAAIVVPPVIVVPPIVVVPPVVDVPPVVVGPPVVVVPPAEVPPVVVAPPPVAVIPPVVVAPPVDAAPVIEGTPVAVPPIVQAPPADVISPIVEAAPFIAPVVVAPLIQNTTGVVLPREVAGLNLTVINAAAPAVRLAVTRPAPAEDLQERGAVAAAPEAESQQSVAAPQPTAPAISAPILRAPRADRN